MIGEKILYIYLLFYIGCLWFADYETCIYKRH